MRWCEDRSRILQDRDASRPLDELRQLHQAAACGQEPARVDVERREILVEADVEELAACCRSAVARCVDERDTDAMVAVAGIDHDVLDERVDKPVPQHVDETDETVAVAANDPAEAVSFGLVDPVPLGLVEEAGIECGCVELVDLVVGEGFTPRVGDVAQTNCPAPAQVDQAPMA